MSQICDRCGNETFCTTMSYFNTQIICIECDDLEQKHPDFEAAREAENEEVRNGNYHFKGVGLPEGYEEWAKKNI